MNNQTQQTIQPIENSVLAGFIDRFQQVFDCPVTYTTAADKAQSLKKLLGGKELKYPYAFITPQNLSSNPDSYSSGRLARQGVIIAYNANVAQRVRLLPTNFELEIEFITNKYQSVEQGSVLSYIRRWLFARRGGYLKFNINYGRLSMPISVTVTDSPSIPPRENVTENDSSYKITANVTIHGYVSEPLLGTVGIIQDVVVNGLTILPDGSMPNSQFFAFNKG